MKTAIGLGIVGATLAGAFALALTRPTQPKVTPATKWRPVPSPVPLDVARMAATLLGLPMGAERIIQLGAGRVYRFHLEPHFHGPEGPPPIGWHKGVTVYQPA
jgi:hypothetical protein